MKSHRKTSKIYRFSRSSTQIFFGRHFWRLWATFQKFSSYAPATTFSQNSLYYKNSPFKVISFAITLRCPTIWNNFYASMRNLSLICCYFWKKLHINYLIQIKKQSSIARLWFIFIPDITCNFYLFILIICWNNL